MSSYPHLFSEWQIRNTTIANRVVFAPTCPTWVADPYEGVFTDQAVAYYEERAKGGCGLIIIGGTIIHPSALYSSFNFPGLWDDKQVDGLAEGRGGRPQARLQDHLPAPARRPARVGGAEDRPRARLRRGVVHGRAEPGPAGRVPERADAEGARGARDPGDLRLVRLGGTAGDRGRARRRRVPHVARLPAVAVPLAALQPPAGPLGRLVREPPALPGRGDDADPGGDRRRALPRLPDQLDLVLAGRPRARGHPADRRRHRAAVRHRLRRPLRRRAPLVHPHADDLRGRLGAGVHARGQDRVDEAGAARRPDHQAGGRRGAARLGRRGRDPARAAALRRRRVGQQGPGGAGGGHPPLRRRELLLAERHPRRPRAVRLQPDRRAREGLGRRDARPRRHEQARPRRRRRPRRARVRARRGGPGPRDRPPGARGGARRPRPLVLEAPRASAVLRGLAVARRAGGQERRRDPAGDRSEAREHRRGDRCRVARARRRRDRRPLPGRRLPGPDRRPAAGARDRQLRRLGRRRSGRARRPATCS